MALPLVEAMLREAYTLPYLCTDASGVLVQQKERCRNGHFWVLVAPDLHVLFRYTPKHDSASVDRATPLRVLLDGRRSLGVILKDAGGEESKL